MARESTIFRDLMKVVEDRRSNPPEKSYTTSLFQGGVPKIGAKIMEEAQEVIPFRLRQPGYLPEGYALCEVLVAPGGSSFLFYESPKGNIILVQISVGGSSGGAGDEGSATAVQVLTAGSIEPVSLNGVAAGWVEDHGLMWEADGISFTVGGPGLSLEEAIRVASSLE